MTNDFAARLESIVSASRALFRPADLEPYAVQGLAPSAVARPTSAQEAAEIVRFATTEKLALIACGARTKLAIGAPPARYDIALDMTGLGQIIHYDPADFTVSVEAGMPLAKLNAALFNHQQFLPLLTPYYFSSTIGGSIASGLDSPLRQFYGTARDFLLGAEFIDGTGALVKSGGRVVKNVTGYDLHKLLIGSLGTLAVITRLNFRTFPAPIVGSRGFVASFPTHIAALALRRKIAASQLTPLTLDVLNPAAAKVFATCTPQEPEVPIFAGENRRASQGPLPLPGEWFRSHEWQVCAAFAGPPEILDRYSRDLTCFAGESRATAVSILDDVTRPAIWGRLREALPLFRESSPAATILRLSLLCPHHAEAISLLQAIALAARVPLALVARAAGTLYIALLPHSTSEAADQASLEMLALLTREVFSLSRSRRGDTTVLFAPPALKARLTAAAPPPSPFALASRLKSAFDPHNTLAPARLHSTI
jgi:glycolate oxidase FAD binding subunit